ncbi:MAG: aminotransferase class III-fold pyridoxal phosphate-dependent enzyme [Nannocystis sp.]|nr:aminotransferase class III-fold pyridoxal phosphate-dependent enzyme [Nannocystis sp.]
MTDLDLFSLQREHLFFTWSSQRDVRPLEILDAAGARFCTREYGWLWDLESQVYNVGCGHRHPHIQRRMIAQIEALPAAAPNALLPIRAELGRLLAAHTGLAKAFLTTGGSEANENAVKIARLVTGRSKIITRRSSYHGATLAILGIAGDDRKRPFEADLAPGLHIDDPYPVPVAAAGDPSIWSRNLDQLLDREDPRTVAAVLLEGFTGTNGMQIPPADFWQHVRRRCDEHGILLIADEIFSGFGRTGRWFAVDHWGVRPDMLVVGKGLTSGYAPLAGVVVNAAIAAHFDDHKLWCGLTTYAHPVSCAAAVGALEVLAAEDLPGNAARVGELLGARLDDLWRLHPQRIRGHRGLGLMRTVELREPAGALARRALDRGLYLPFKGDAIFLCPPLCLTSDDVGEIVARLEQALAP